MIYTDFQELKLSRLGFGTMRLPVNEHDKKIDEEKAAEMVGYAIGSGINYFDTAYFYHNGESERFIGETLSNFPRDSFYLADKMPGNAMDIVDGKIRLDLSGFSLEDIICDSPAKVFERQLEKCGVDYFDFYMLHNLSEGTYDLYINEDIGIISYLLEQKKNGRIRHLGLSSHGRPETIDKFLSNYNFIEFAQIQLNYLDWSLQEAGRKYEVITKHGIPVIVMEPVRGGKLANPGERGEAILKAERPDEAPASWAFRYVNSLPNAAVILSGMSSMEQLKENLEIFEKNDPFTEHDKSVVKRVADTFADFVQCTSCRYCCEKCPQGLDIPRLISTFNEASVGMSWLVYDSLDNMKESEKPQACTGCGSCRKVCPQEIDIPGVIKGFVKKLERKKK